MRTIQDLAGQPLASKLLSTYLKKESPSLLIFHGPNGTGRWSAAEAYVNQQLCLVKTACGTCIACKKIQAGTHSDLIQFPAEKTLIGNPDNPAPFTIRWLLRKKVRYTPFDADKRFIIIPRADLIQNEAETALLKTLEESPDHTKFLFIIEKPQDLKPAILSRGVLVPFGRLSHENIKKLTGSVLSEQDLNCLGGSLHYLPLLQNDIVKIITEKINEALRHPLSLLDLETWIVDAANPGFSDLLKENEYNYEDLVDFFGLMLIVLTTRHPKKEMISQAVFRFKESANLKMSGMIIYSIGKLFHELNTIIHNNK